MNKIYQMKHGKLGKVNIMMILILIKFNRMYKVNINLNRFNNSNHLQKRI